MGDKLALFSLFYRALRSRFILRHSLNVESAFTHIFKSNAWSGEQSISGSGSDNEQTKIIAEKLPILFKSLNIEKLLDIPCGDFQWMQYVDLANIHYIGADIVKELVQSNKQKFARNDREFSHLNLMEDKLPDVQLIFCRDCLVHLSYADIQLVLNNVCESNAEYFLATTFPSKKKNHDIRTGHWRPINLERAPFLLPPPIQIINEGCTQFWGYYKDKSLGLWKVADIRAYLEKKSED